MNRPQLRKLADHILATFDDTKIVKLSDELEDAIRELALANDRVEVMQLAEEIADQARAVLGEAIQSLLSSNAYAPLKVENSFLVGARFVHGQAPPLWQFADLLDAISKLDEKEFEYLGWTLLRSLGVENVVQTPLTRDGGVDFFGTLPIQVRGTRPIDVLVAAEFKSAQVSTPELRAFEEGVHRQVYLHGRASDRGKIPLSTHLYRRTPIIFLIFCATRLSSDARYEANEDGIIIFESAQIANIIEPLISRLENVKLGLESLIYNGKRFPAPK